MISGNLTLILGESKDWRSLMGKCLCTSRESSGFGMVAKTQVPEHDFHGLLAIRQVFSRICVA